MQYCFRPGCFQKIIAVFSIRTEERNMYLVTVFLLRLLAALRHAHAAAGLAAVLTERAVGTGVLL